MRIEIMCERWQIAKLEPATVDDVTSIEVIDNGRAWLVKYADGESETIAPDPEMTYRLYA